MQVAGLHEGVDGRAADVKDFGGLFRQQEGLSGQHVAEQLRICHVANGGGAAFRESPVTLAVTPAGPVSSSRAPRDQPPGTGEVLKVEPQYKFGAPVMWARRR
jgi:hypothetical protein